MNILDEASAIVDGPRQASYGDPKVNHARTAALWSAYLGVPITPRQVCMLNVLQKVSRDAHSPKRDNLVDIAGWARNAELVDIRAAVTSPTEPPQAGASLTSSAPASSSKIADGCCWCGATLTGFEKFVCSPCRSAAWKEFMQPVTGKPEPEDDGA